MFASSALRFGSRLTTGFASGHNTATTATILRTRPFYFAQAKAPKSSIATSTTTTTRTTGSSARARQSSSSSSSFSSSSSAVKIAVGLSGGALFLCGLDFVAPSNYPYHDGAASYADAKTYWNDSGANNPRLWTQTTTTNKALTASSNNLPPTPRPLATSASSSLTSSYSSSSPNVSCNIDGQQYRVVIVGGGMAGLHTALALKERMNYMINQQQQQDNNNDDHNNNRILILDANAIGQSASGRSKGLAVPGLQVPQEDLARICGSKQMANHIYDLTYKASRRLGDIISKYDIQCNWIQTGHVEATLHDDDASADADDSNDNNDDEEEEDDGCKDLTAAQVRRILGQPNSSKIYKGGEFDPSCYGVDPLALTLGLANVLEDKYEVQIQEQTKVTKIEKKNNNNLLLPSTTPPSLLTSSNGSSSRSSTDDGQNKESTMMRYTVTTENGSKVECQHVVLCTGPELVSKDLSQRLKHAVIPIYTWMASTAPLGQNCPLQNGAVDDLLVESHAKTDSSGGIDNTINTTTNTDIHHETNPPPPPPSSASSAAAATSSPAPMCGDDYVCLNYWRRTEDGRILFGSLADAYPVPKWVAEYRLRRSLQQVYPQLRNVKFDHVWGGKLAFSRDSVPLIGRDEAFDHCEHDRDHNGVVVDPTKGGVWYATGFGGHGIIPTCMAGSILADAITGYDDETWRLFQRQFPPKYTFWPVSQLGAQAVLTIYNVFDWLHVKGVPVPQLPKPW